MQLLNSCLAPSQNFLRKGFFGKVLNTVKSLCYKLLNHKTAYSFNSINDCILLKHREKANTHTHAHTHVPNTSGILHYPSCIRDIFYSLGLIYTTPSTYNPMRCHYDFSGQKVLPRLLLSLILPICEFGEAFGKLSFSAHSSHS